MQRKILVTGAAGFIGYHLCQKLLIQNDVIGIDNINSYYDKKLKLDRIKNLEKTAQESNGKWTFYKEDIENKDYQ